MHNARTMHYGSDICCAKIRKFYLQNSIPAIILLVEMLGSTFDARIIYFQLTLIRFSGDVSFIYDFVMYGEEKITYIRWRNWISREISSSVQE